MLKSRKKLERKNSFSFVYVVDETWHKEISRRSRESCSDGKERSVMLVQNGVSLFLPICNFPVPLARSLPPVPVVVSSEAAND